MVRAQWGLLAAASLLLIPAVAQPQARDDAAAWNRLVESNPTMPGHWDGLGTASKRARDYPSAIRAFRRSLELGASYPASTAYDIAACYALSGDKENALSWLSRSVSLGLRSLSWAQDDEELESLRSDPRFQALTLTADVPSMKREQGWRHDLAFLASELKRRHYAPFRKVSQAQFDAAVADLNARIPSLKDEQIETGLMHLARMMGDGHTYLRPQHARAPNLRAIPVQFFFFSEGLFIVRASPAHAGIVGLRVVRIGEHTPQELLKRMDPIISRDNEMTPMMIGPELMVHPRLLFGLGLIPDVSRLTLTVAGRDGKSRSVTLDEEARQSQDGWRSARPEEGPEVPLYLKNLNSNYWFEYVPASKLVYFQFNVVREATEPLTAFLNRLFRFVDEHDVDRFVIDLRWNSGGTRLLNRHLIHHLIRSGKVNQPGKLFVIVGRYTFSAGMMLATEIEQNTPAIFAGEPTGSSPNFIGQDVTLRLPYSGMQGSLSDAYWQNSSAFDFRVWISPQLYTPPSFDAYATGRDLVLEAILGYKPPSAQRPR